MNGGLDHTGCDPQRGSTQGGNDILRLQAANAVGAGAVRWFSVAIGSLKRATVLVQARPTATVRQPKGTA
jgi:hypothetical protein